ncbi:hypothetical protein GFD17_04430 [Bifidobacterium sp. SMB2]|uniref:Tail fiber protein n=1 Tax=Bifidobacterium saimiriisciurei TaxID=2661627 RepID=A0ABX0C861_9BIFI|nr:MULTISPECIES: hypothetical protein [Bifidobacterium]NEG96016.1 hypothetical protein [Bifidobacterium sp. SMB2]NEH10906.1 hypothetical protein [Bifidobacterium saimiriisciurei]
MQSLKYVCATTGDEIPMSGPDIFAQTAEGIRGRAWGYSLGYRDLSGVTRDAREASLELTYLRCPEKLDWTRRLFDADVANHTPGVLDADGWRATAYVVKAEASDIKPNVIRQKLTVVLSDGMWRRAGDVQHFWSDALQPGLDLDHPYDYPHDYLPTTRNVTASNPMPTAMGFTMVVFGPASSPQIVIGSNTYRLDMDIPSGAYVTITAVGRQRTIVMTAENGDVSNVFAKGYRGSGRDGGSYIFQPIPPGDNPVNWKGFGFDLTVWEEESEPPWA